MSAKQPSEQQLADDSRRAGRQLAAAFNNGAEPQPVSLPLATQPGEFCVGQMPVTVFQFLEGDGSYERRSGGWMLGGGILGGLVSAASVTSNVVGNARRRSKAAQDAQGAWRPTHQGVVYLTNRRWSLNADRTWHDWWFNGIRMSHCDSKMIILELVGMPPTGLMMPGADYWYVMFNKLAYDRVVMPELPSDGRDLPMPNGPESGGPDESGPGREPRWTHRETA